MAPNDRLKQFIQIPICRGLKESEAKAILDIAEERKARAGEDVFREGDGGDGVYLLLEGSVSITKKDKAGKAQPLAQVSDGSAVGEMSLITGDAPRSATATATTDSKLLKISSARFSKLLAQDDVAALKIVRNLAQVMARRLHLASDKMVDLMDKPKRKEELADFQRILTNWSF